MAGEWHSPGAQVHTHCHMVDVGMYMIPVLDMYHPGIQMWSSIIYDAMDHNIGWPYLLGAVQSRNIQNLKCRSWLHVMARRQ